MAGLVLVVAVLVATAASMILVIARRRPVLRPQAAPDEVQLVVARIEAMTRHTIQQMHDVVRYELDGQTGRQSP